MAGSADAELDPNWEALPYSIFQRLVQSVLSNGPRHQAHHCLAALRRVCRHWRAAVDDSLDTYSAVQRQAATGPHPLCRWRHSLRNLELKDSFVDSALLRAIHACTGLTSIRLVSYHPQLNSPALSCLAHRSLRQLELDGYGHGGLTTLKPLLACTQLEAFTLESGEAVDLTADVAALVQVCPRMQRLALYRCVRPLPRLSQQPFDLGSTAPQLTSLRLSASCTEDDAWVRLFQALTHLQHLDIQVSPQLGDAGLLAITSLAGSLTSLHLRGDGRLTPNGMTALGHLPRLQSLKLTWLSARLADRSLLPLVALRLTQLTRLDISGCNWTDLPLAFEHLTQLRLLRSLKASDRGLTPEHVAAALGRMPSLRQLDIAENPRVGGGQSFTPLSRLTGLEELNLSGCQPGSYDFLGSLSQLHSVKFFPSQGIPPSCFAASTLHHLADAACSTLTALQLAACGLDSGSLEQLRRLTALCALDLSGCFWVEHPAPQQQGQTDADQQATCPDSSGVLQPAEPQDSVSRQLELIPPTELLTVLQSLPQLHSLKLVGTQVGPGWRQLAAEGFPGPGILRIVGPQIG